MSTKTSILFAAVFSAATSIYAQSSILGTNLIVNGNAESGPAASSFSTLVSTIPGWTVTGSINVLPYNLTGQLQLTDPAPPDHGFQYFAQIAGANAPATLTQNIDVSSGASMIATGNIKFTAAAYLGDTTGGSGSAQMSVAFKNSAGQTFSTPVVGPLNGIIGLRLQQQIGLVPVGTVTITVTLTLAGYEAAADSLSLVLTTLGTNPSSVLGTNLALNGNAEAASGQPYPTQALYIPDWSSDYVTVTPYGGANWISTSDEGPADRGVNLFAGGGGGRSTMYQYIDVSPAAALIDSGQVTYEASAWLGSINGVDPTLTYVFSNWSGQQLAATGTLPDPNHSYPGVAETSQSGTLPSGTRVVYIQVTFPVQSLADDINLTLTAPGGPPTIFSSVGLGIDSASAFGGFAAIAPGTWIEIYGSFLTSSPLRNNCGGGIQGSCWAGSDFNNGVAPTSLDGVSVSIGGKAAYIDYTSPTQVNALVPSNAPVGPSMVTVTNANGMSEPFPIYINQTQPGLLAPPGSFVINNKQYVAGILSDGSFALPANAIPGVASRPANPGETVIFYGVGFGPTLPNFPAGTVVTGQNELATPIQFLFNTTSVTPAYWGLAPNYTGLYQFNVVAPNVSTNNALPLSFSLGGVKGTQTLYIAVN
ncbi:MAG TPA: hypothetical protein VIY49_22850 [Bryobacteraceae bacterium]